MIPKTQKNSPQSFRCLENLTAYQKVKNFKGIRNLQWDANRTPLKIDIKRLRRLSIKNTRYFIKGEDVRPASTILKYLKGIERLSIESETENEQDFTKNIKIFKKLNPLKLKTLQFTEQFLGYKNEKSLPSIEKSLKLFPKLEGFACPSLKPGMKEEALKRALRVFQKMPNISRVSLAVQLNPQFLQIALPILRSSIIPNPKISLKLDLSISRYRSSEDCKNILGILQNFGQLRELAIDFHILPSDSACQEVAEFFQTNPQLESLSFKGKMQEGTSLYLPLSQLPRLKKLALSFSSSEVLKKENFATSIKSISGCRSLKEFSLSLSSYHTLDDQCIASLTEAASDLECLESLDLNFSAFWGKPSSLSSLSVDLVAQMLLQMKSLKHLKLDFSHCKKFKDKSVRALLETISQLSDLKQLEMFFARTDLTDEAFMGLAQVFDRLSKIESFYLSLPACRAIQGEFLKPISKFIRANKERVKGYSDLGFSLFESGIKKDLVGPLRAEIKQSLYPAKFLKIFCEEET